MRAWFGLPVILCGLVLGQTPTLENEVLVGPGVTVPKPVHKAEPEYTPQARAARVQGIVVVEIVIDERGTPTNLSVISPLGFGLDERALEAVGQWKFRPGLKDGKPVKVRAIVEVHFRFPELWHDAKAERRRTDFNEALRNLQRGGEKAATRAVETIQRLAVQEYPPALYLEAIWRREGLRLPRDDERCTSLLRKAAEKDYGPAMYEVGQMLLDGRGAPANPEAGFKLIREAAVLGSSQAQFYLGARYEKGDGVVQDVDRARRYFRLCAAGREPVCQLRLAEMLLHLPDRQERDYVQAIAWLQLAAEQNLAAARSLLEKEGPAMTAGQVERVEKLKSQLSRQPL